MRVRNKPWAEPYITAHPNWIVTNPDRWIGKWKERFPNPNQPLQLEIGTGKGQFIVEMAKKYPQINFLGIEIQTSVIAMALRKAVNNELTNIQFLHTDGIMVDRLFNQNEVDAIYLNFSDPWPKKRHEKRRLTSPRFLNSYSKVLSPDAPIKFKTDNRGLFEYSLKTFNNQGLVFDDISLNLHNSPENKNNVQTEYEEKFSQNGPIYQAVVHFNRKN
ncbi:tRNA (guanine-N(7)-)-methyltransferase [Philodulcilactobacillus myokoensis]|uniref:tRNA (guanine-N(7)-)-methyltransferase n=1 Tax=Philodulcilactobacillus myokoensis TaxID=2929573 RepID=A0A9W6B248_9LACO|nr:tRNA (guanosine(46)-N7)-methyltransferase TrmB [Philodulcilactobacillus myokoensis]GLB46739.1 tRNA (guanine-N(7)-)-methyltransferase [Philodulcilactobacillus myokoensis]